MPQFIFLLDDSIRSNVAFGVPSDKIDDNRVRECLQIAQILDFIETVLPAYKFDALLRRENVDRYDDRLLLRTQGIC